MTIRIWLNEAGEKSIVLNSEKTRMSGAATEQFGKDGLTIETDRDSGRKYINVYADIMSPTTILPRIAHKVTKLVTYEGKIYEGFRTDGIYKAKGATLRVVTIENIKTAYGLQEHIERERYQTISISGGSIRSCQFIYNGVRNGSIRVESNWALSQYELPQSKPADSSVH